MYLQSAFFFLFLPILSAVSPGPNPNLFSDPPTVQPFQINQSPPATIPAFPEQSNLAGCPLDLPDELFDSINSACGKHQLHRGRCCPVLASWLYSAYSDTALRRSQDLPALPEDLPVLPDDSETCVDGLGRALRRRGIELAKPNETCDVVYCYCGIRLHPLSCPDVFEMNAKGKPVGNKNLKRLERDCSKGFPGLDGCNECLKSLYKLNGKKASTSDKPEDNRTTKMHNKDCQLMGLTWLLSKNRTAYIHTVTSVLRAIMMSSDGSDPQSCTLGSDGMPLAVDSSELSDQSSATILPKAPIYISILLISLTFVTIISHHLPVDMS